MIFLPYKLDSPKRGFPLFTLFIIFSVAGSIGSNIPLKENTPLPSNNFAIISLTLTLQPY